MSTENAVHCTYKDHVPYSAIMVPVIKKKKCWQQTFFFVITYVN